MLSGKAAWAVASSRSIRSAVTGGSVWYQSADSSSPILMNISKFSAISGIRSRKNSICSGMLSRWYRVPSARRP